MAVYAYIATGAGGAETASIEGTITADSPRQARDQLRARGLSVRDIVEQTPRSRHGRWTRYLIKRQSPKVTGLLQDLSTLLAAGLPLLDALDTAARQHAGRFQQAILLLRDHVAGGGGLAEAMGLQPELFDPVCISIVEVGENAGTLDNSLARLVAFRTRSAGLKNRLALALIYPAIVLAVGLAVSVFFMTYVAPNILGVLVASGKELPTATVVIKAMSDFLVAWWWAALLAVIALAAAVGTLLKRERVRAGWDRLQLRIPLVGDLIRKQAIARMAMVMATLLESGVVFVRAVQIARGTVGNHMLREALVACEEAVYAGRDIAAALEKTSAFPPLVIQIFAVGQASGQLERMLENLAADYDAQVDLTSSRLMALLEPVMVILLAIVVLFIAFATILPILEAGDVL